MPTISHKRADDIAQKIWHRAGDMFDKETGHLDRDKLFRVIKRETGVLLRYRQSQDRVIASLCEL